MNERERPYVSAVEEAEALLRHPSMFGDAPNRLHREALQRHAAEKLCGIAMHLHDFFRYGDPAATPALELFMHENNTGRHAEVMLDEINAALHQLGLSPDQGAV